LRIESEEVAAEVKTPPKKRIREETPMFKGASKGPEKKTKGSTGKELDEAEIEVIFASFADEDDPECITMDGIEKLSEKLDMDPSTDIKLLVFLWKMNAVSKPGTVTKKEFSTGMMTVFKRDSIEGLKSIIPTLDPGFLERGPFREFYKFVFQFSREGTHKTIEKDVIAALLPLVLDSNRAPHITFFLAFLSASTHQRITLDQWDSFLQFQTTVDLDLSNYDAEGACKSYYHCYQYYFNHNITIVFSIACFLTWPFLRR
jgi:hypothetical protein